MYLILDDLKAMIKMQGGKTEGIKDIGIAVKTLRKLMEENRANQSYQSRHEDKRRERHFESEED